MHVLRGSEIARYHQQRLLDIARFAAEAAAPFYAHRLAPLLAGQGYEQRRWLEVPILERATLVAAGQDVFVAPDRFPQDAGDVRTTTTSGTVGQPLRLATNKLADVFSQLKYRSYFADWAVSANNDVLTVRLPKAHEQEHRGKMTTNPLPGGARGREFTLFAVEPAKALAALLDTRPSYIRAYPTLLHAVAIETRRSGRAVSIELAMTVGETLHTDVRSFIEETFSTRVADAYSTEELGLVAYLCPQCGHYHCNNEGLYVELINAQGQPARIGETGRVVITSLYNYATPLIRYAIGDYATRGNPRGKCSDRGLSLTRIDGRERNLFRLPSGGQVWPHITASELYRLGITEIEVTQTSVDTLDIAYRSDSPIEAGALAALAKLQISPEYEVIERRVERIEGAASGKRAIYVSRLS